MAELIFNQDSRLNRLTKGEKRLAKLLKVKLEDDYLCWCNVPIGARRQYPDFIILHPRRGLLILEVKDWRLDAIQRIDKGSATLLTSRGLTKEANPLEQARQYVLALIDRLRRDPALRHSEGHPHQGKLCFPFGYGAVLANISRQQFDGTDIGEAIEPRLVICKDEMVESIDTEDFQTRLWNMFPYYFDQVLTLPQIDRIRWHIFPEVRVTQGTLFPGEAPDEKPEEADPALPDLIYVMDLEQEKLARRLGEGHRIIHGVAGSGKTMILGYRCQHLAAELQKPILVLCYNVSLAAKLRWLIARKNLAGHVSVRHFHGWCDDQLRLYHVPKPAPGEAYAERLVQQVIGGVERGQIPNNQYGAVLIDEAHDFALEWLRLVAGMVDPGTNSLLVLYDDAQSIYAKRGGLKFNLSEAGIEARGRTRILKINYRNTTEVLALAYEFAKEVFTSGQNQGADVPLVQPESIGRHGPLPELVRLPSLQAESDHLAKRLHALHESGIWWGDMAVIYRSHFMGEVLARHLRSADIPVEWLHEDKSKRHYHPEAPSIKMMTMHASKGLEFPVVAIPGLGYLPNSHADPQDEAKLLYVAMTRAMDHLILSYHRETEFTRRLGEACLGVAA